MTGRTYGLGPAKVYRCYGDGVLLYIGATTCLSERLNQHLTLSAWAHLMDDVTVTDHESLAAARQVEAQEIYDLRPRWNIHGRGSRAGWGLSDYVEVALATHARADQAWKPENSRRKVTRLLAEMRRRFPGIADLVIEDLSPHLRTESA